MQQRLATAEKWQEQVGKTLTDDIKALNEGKKSQAAQIEVVKSDLSDFKNKQQSNLMSEVNALKKSLDSKDKDFNDFKKEANRSQV